MPTLKELYAKKGELVAKMREVAEDKEAFARVEKEFDEVLDSIKRQEKIKKAEEALVLDSASMGKKADIEPDNQEDKKVYASVYDRPDYHMAYAKFLRNGNGSPLNALQVDQDSKGGYFVPTETSNMLIKALDDFVFIRGLATVESIPMADSLGIPTLDTDIDDAEWTTELGTGDEGDMDFGMRELKPSPVAKRIKLSKTLARKTSNIERLIIDRLTYKFGVTQEKAFLTGTGAGQPLGLFTASTNGISTSRDVNTGAAAGVTSDGILDAFYSLKAPYRRASVWMMHRDVIKLVAKLKDNDGQYIWQAGLREGEPDRLKGRPVYESEFAPNTISAGNYAYIFGDMSKYMIADSLAMSVQVLTELYAESNQNGYIARLETDGMPALGEAFARGKFGA